MQSLRLMKWLLLPTTFLLFGCSGNESNDNSTSSANPTSSNAPKAISAPNSSEPFLIANVSFAGITEALPGTSKIFVFARPVGQRMPLAVQQFTPAQLPVKVAFSNPDTDATEVEVVARLSLTGAVVSHGGDPEIVQGPFAIDKSHQISHLVIPPVSATAAQPTKSSRTIRSHGANKTLIKFTVTLPQDLEIPPTAAIFIIAKPVGQTQGMPIAALKLTPADTNQTIGLSDKDAMISVNKLSHHQQVSLLARLSMSGQSAAQAGDLQSETLEIDIGDEQVHELTIANQVNP